MSGCSSYIVNTKSTAASGPDLTLGATNVVFGDVAVNSPATQMVTLTSSGRATLTINAASATGTGFSLGEMSFPVVLSPGQMATLQVQFTPTLAGNASGAVVLTSNAASGQTATIALSGTGQVVTYEVALNWRPPADPATLVAGYNVYRATGGCPSYQLLNSSVDAGTSFTDITVQNGTSYSYYVESVDAAGNQSAPSNIYSVDIPSLRQAPPGFVTQWLSKGITACDQRVEIGLPNGCRSGREPEIE